VIVVENGRPRSVYTEEDRDAELEALVRSLSREEREALEAVLSDPSGGLIRQIMREDYEREPVGPRQFLEDDYYLGAIGSKMWPKLRGDFVELFEGGYTSAALGGSLGWGKSFFSACGILYVVYMMSCLRNPQRTYGLAPGSQIELILVSVTNNVVRRRLIPEVRSKMDASPYFRDFLTFEVAQSIMEIRIPTKNIMIVGGSSTSVSIGGNVFGGLIDEISFMDESKGYDSRGKSVSMDRGEGVANSVTRRMKSRFQKFGKLPGILFQVSSKERPVAYIEKLIQQAREANDPTVFVREYNIMDVKPAESFSSRRFKVATGNERIRPMLDPSDEQERMYLDAGLRVLEIPEDFRPDFEKDLEGSLREIAGISTEAISPYIQRTDKIYAAQDLGSSHGVASPVDDDEWVASTQLQFFWERIARRQEVRLPSGGLETVWTPTRHPGARRHAHIDLAVTGDAAGLVIGHVVQWVDVRRRDRALKEYTDVAPVIEIDLCLRILPPPGDEIDFGAVREIVYQFAEHGFLFNRVTFDTYQSVEPRQQFRQKGIDADVQSMDSTTAPYDTTKDALYEGRIWFCSPCDVLVEEMVDLRRVVVKRANGLGVKVDHPKVNRHGAKGRKDVSDSLAGVVFSITSYERGDIVPIVRGASPEDDGQENQFSLHPKRPFQGDGPKRRIARMPFDR
jgi:hypothetical protein